MVYKIKYSVEIYKYSALIFVVIIPKIPRNKCAILIWNDYNKYYWRFCSPKKEIICTGHQGYYLKESAERGIKPVKIDGFFAGIIFIGSE